MQAPLEESDRRPIAYLLHCFPQLSETFVENEMRALRSFGEELIVFSVYRPPAGLEGPTTLDPARFSYPPSVLIVAGHFLLWAIRRPVATTRNVWRALGIRSLTMLRGAWLAGWVASGVRRSRARHLHAHFAHDSASTGLAAAALTRLPFTFTLHAHEIYLRTNGLCMRCRLADRVITVCDYNVDQLLARCPSVRREHIEVVYCGVDPDGFTCVAPLQRSGAEGEGPLRLLSVGRLVGQKGFEDLIRAVALLRDRGHCISCEIVGHGPLRQELHDLIGELGVEKQVALVGPLMPEAVARRMAECDVFVLACRIDELGNRDSMPVVVKEAMASCVPVVATSAVGIPEMVDAEVGRLAAPDDPGSLADAIEELLALPAGSRRELGQRGRARVEERFNLFTETAKLRRVFDQVAG
ncbi:MAG: glycosyltransferase [Acidimicrobiales bacterium]